MKIPLSFATVWTCLILSCCERRVDYSAVSDTQQVAFFLRQPNFVLYAQTVDFFFSPQIKESIDVAQKVAQFWGLGDKSFTVVETNTFDVTLPTDGCVFRNAQTLEIFLRPIPTLRALAKEKQANRRAISCLHCGDNTNCYRNLISKAIILASMDYALRQAKVPLPANFYREPYRKLPPKTWLVLYHYLLYWPNRALKMSSSPNPAIAGLPNFYHGQECVNGVYRRPLCLAMVARRELEEPGSFKSFILEQAAVNRNVITGYIGKDAHITKQDYIALLERLRVKLQAATVPDNSVKL